MMDEIDGKMVVIKGASSGLGAAVARWDRSCRAASQKPRRQRAGSISTLRSPFPEGNFASVIACAIAPSANMDTNEILVRSTAQH